MIEADGKMSGVKRYRCRSRKRFVKLLMSEGYSRNWAREWADFMRRQGYSYQDAYFEMYFVCANGG